MSLPRWRVVAAVPVLVVAAWALAFGTSQLIRTVPIHETADAIVSTAKGARGEHTPGSIEKSERLARALIVAENLPGLSVAVAVNGQVVWAEGFGWSDAESRTPLTPLTRFRLGALSKPLTAFAVALLHDQGRLDLDAPVQRYVPAYPQKQWPVTTRQLLGDVAGVARIRGDNNDAMPVTHCESVDEAVTMLHDDPLLFEPGTRYKYSIWGWVLVSAAVEGAAGEPFDRFMVRRVFEPLSMVRTAAEESGDLDDGPARFNPPRSFLGIRLDPQEADRPDYSCVAGGGAFLSTPTDLVRLGSAMLKPGRLKAETIAAFQTPARLANGTSTTYGLGWTVAAVQLAGESTKVLSHRGSPWGGTVSLLTFPDLGLAVAAAANVTAGAGVHTFATQVAEVFVK